MPTLTSEIQSLDLDARITVLLGSINHLPSGQQSFGIDLAMIYKRYHKLSTKQDEWVTKLIVKATECSLKPKGDDVQTASELSEFNINLTPILDLFAHASKNLKKPRISLFVGDDNYIFYLGKNGVISIVGPGVFPTRAYYGRINADGSYKPGYSDRAVAAKAAVYALLQQLLNPAAVAKAHGKLTGKCCFCSLPLTDKRSTAAGFGPVCAEHYGLKVEWDEAAGVLDELSTSNYVTAGGEYEVIDFDHYAASGGTSGIFGDGLDTEVHP